MYLKLGLVCISMLLKIVNTAKPKNVLFIIADDLGILLRIWKILPA
jgi:hypothetical protein